MIVLVEYLINKVAGLPKACNLIKKRLQHKCFLVAFEKFLRTPFFTGTSRGCLCKYSFQSQNVRYLLLVNHYTYPILELQIYQVLMLYKFMIAYHKHISSSLIKNYVCTKNNFMESDKGTMEVSTDNYLPNTKEAISNGIYSEPFQHGSRTIGNAVIKVQCDKGTMEVSTDNYLPNTKEAISNGIYSEPLQHGSRTIRNADQVHLDISMAFGCFQGEVFSKELHFVSFSVYLHFQFYKEFCTIQFDRYRIANKSDPETEKTNLMSRAIEKTSQI